MMRCLGVGNMPASNSQEANAESWCPLRFDAQPSLAHRVSYKRQCLVASDRYAQSIPLTTSTYLSASPTTSKCVPVPLGNEHLAFKSKHQFPIHPHICHNSALFNGDIPNSCTASTNGQFFAHHVVALPRLVLILTPWQHLGRPIYATGVIGCTIKLRSESVQAILGLASFLFSHPFPTRWPVSKISVGEGARMGFIPANSDATMGLWPA